MEVVTGLGLGEGLGLGLGLGLGEGLVVGSEQSTGQLHQFSPAAQISLPHLVQLNVPIPGKQSSPERVPGFEIKPEQQLSPRPPELPSVIQTGDGIIELGASIAEVPTIQVWVAPFQHLPSPQLQPLLKAWVHIAP